MGRVGVFGAGGSRVNRRRKRGGRAGWGCAVEALPGLLTRQPENPVIQQGGQSVTHCGPVLIGKGVGPQVNIGPPESLL